ncbi:MAG: hypothetical protein A3I66_12555 [Burkholderiales bacterium RIFCSPLOWO2_02_FULL_57_36]|nr:MAG: hypothetical protein A3I66_12555 [Burkholderiales bacterium RIFCSPLOWO2_02_FULL_57_36]
MLSSLDRNFIFSTIQKCHLSNTAEDLEEVITYFVGRFIPHKIGVCGIANVETKAHSHCLEFGSTHGVLKAMPPTFCLKNNLLLPLWRKKRIPIYSTIADLSDLQLTEDQKIWREKLVSHGITNLVMHGVRDIFGGFASFFYLCSVPEPMTDQQSLIFSMLAPHLHHALLSVTHLNTANTMKDEGHSMHAAALSAGSRPAIDKPDWRLTPRESEILKWIYYGKTNPETAMILGISELTVRNHIQNLMLKLGVGNRTQAVVKAMQNNFFVEQNQYQNGSAETAGALPRMVE